MLSRLPGDRRRSKPKNCWTSEIEKAQDFSEVLCSSHVALFFELADQQALDDWHQAVERRKYLARDDSDRR